MTNENSVLAHEAIEQSEFRLTDRAGVSRVDASLVVSPNHNVVVELAD